MKTTKIYLERVAPPIGGDWTYKIVKLVGGTVVMSPGSNTLFRVGDRMLERTADRLTEVKHYEVTCASEAP